MKTLIFLAKGFEIIEFSVFVDVMGWARNDHGHNTQTLTCGFEKEVVSTFGVRVVVDELIENINVDDFDALAIPGGFEVFGYYKDAYNEKFLNLIREFHSKGKIIASVCVGALPVGKSGILKNKSATTYHFQDGFRQKQLSEFGVNIINKPVVVEENIITSSCPETAIHVAFILLEKLTSKEEMEVVKKSMGY